MKLQFSMVLLIIFIIGCKSDNEVAPSKHLYLKVVFKNQSLKFENTIEENTKPAKPYFASGYSSGDVETSSGSMTPMATIHTTMNENGIVYQEGFNFQYYIYSIDKKFLEHFQSDLENKKLFAAHLKGKTITSKDINTYKVGFELREANGRVFSSITNVNNELDYTLTIKDAEVIINPNHSFTNKEVLKVYAQFKGKVKDIKDVSQIEVVEGEMISLFMFPN